MTSSQPDVGFTLLPPTGGCTGKGGAGKGGAGWHSGWGHPRMDATSRGPACDTLSRLTILLAGVTGLTAAAGTQLADAVLQLTPVTHITSPASPVNEEQA